MTTWVDSYPIPTSSQSVWLICRCWLFACLNAMRIAFNKSKTLEDFEFSQGYLFFWDKVC